MTSAPETQLTQKGIRMQFGIISGTTLFLWRQKALLAVLSAVVVLGTAAPALAFDPGPHSEIIRDAMTAEGFGGDAVGVAQVNSWFSELYEESGRNPFSGNGGWWKRVLAGAITAEKWPDSVAAAARRNHFDNRPALFNTAAITAEWERLQRAVWTLAQEARDRNDPAEMAAVLGISLHEVADFYAHSNWIEPRSGHGLPGADGPGWQERGFGSNPTWFDLPPATREAVTVYTDESQGHRPHGYWNSDQNLSVRTAMNKDWPGRPYYMQAAITAYFASRQWLQAVRSWVGDDNFWARARHYHADQSQLDHDLEGMFNISLYTGHWQGQGEPLGGDRPGPGGSLLGARQALKHYFQQDLGQLGGTFVQLGPLAGRTEYRSRFESLVRRVQDPNPSGMVGPVQSSQGLQRSKRIVVLRIPRMVGEGLGDPGPDQADMYARVKIDGQPMASAIIGGKDEYSFPRPNAPFTWFKVVPAVPDEGEPVESVEVEIKTADARWAGTDDDVYLRLGANLRFPLDKRLYNDFERGDHDTYSVPIDGAVWDGMRVGDITDVQIEKSHDGIAGGWKLGGVKLRVNGREIYDNQHIERWLEGDKRTWTAPDFEASAPRGGRIPIVLNLREDDTLYGGDDEGDLNPYDGRDIVAIGYQLGTFLPETTKGGNRLGGRLGRGGDGASIAYVLETLTPELIDTENKSLAPPGPKPDLIITAFTLSSVTVKNQGEGAAGPFLLRTVNDEVGEESITFAGLSTGASETRKLPGPSGCEGALATVDDLEQIDETDETNNTRDSGSVIC